MKALKYFSCSILLRTQSLVAPLYQFQNLLTDGNVNGIYFYQLKATPNGGQAGSYIETKKMVLMK